MGRVSFRRRFRACRSCLFQLVSLSTQIFHSSPVSYSRKRQGARVLRKKSNRNRLLTELSDHDPAVLTSFRFAVREQQQIDLVLWRQSIWLRRGTRLAEQAHSTTRKAADLKPQVRAWLAVPTAGERAACRGCTTSNSAGPTNSYSVAIYHP